MITFSVFGTQYSAMAQTFRTGLQTPSRKKNNGTNVSDGVANPVPQNGVANPIRQNIHHSPFTIHHLFNDRGIAIRNNISGIDYGFYTVQ